MGMKELGALVKAEREARNLSQLELAEAVGIARSYVSKLERGQQEGIGFDVLRNLAQVLGQPYERLESLLRDLPYPPAAPNPEPSREIPVVADLSAGPTGGGVIDHYEYVSLSETRGRLLRAGKCTGECMVPEINPGDTVIFDAANKNPRDGQTVVATIPDPGNERGRGVVKRFYRAGKKVKLDPIVGQPIVLDASDVLIEGVVVEVRRKYAA